MRIRIGERGILVPCPSARLVADAFPSAAMRKLPDTSLMHILRVAGDPDQRDRARAVIAVRQAPSEWEPCAFCGFAFEAHGELGECVWT